MIDRRVRIVDERDGSESRVRRFSDFSLSPNLVLLGDPGGGKTKLFEDAAAADAGQYLKARIFLLLPAAQLQKTLFIDALDEQRAATDDTTAVDGVVRKLFECMPEQVRLSCREQDWLGDTDLAALNTYFASHGGVTVLRLVPIDRGEQIEILSAHGVGAAEAETFLEESEARGLGELVRNPQKMLMLSRVVRSGVWPKSTSDLFRRATDLQLAETNKDHARTKLGQFTAEELRLTAGAICAARLIADIEGVCLEPNGPSEHYPSYRSLSFLDGAKVEAALHRPFFVAKGGPKCVDYDHRTSAEFLAAHWIADTVRKGLPIGRLAALIGVGGHPAAELRGLHAWLPIALPSYAKLFIESDPLGVLEYGDAASLSPGDRAALLDALGALAKDNPWFLGRDRNAAAIGQLVQADNVASLCAILKAPDSPRDLRTLALEAFEAAAPQADAFDTLVQVFTDAKAYWGDRHRALDCLFAFGDKGAAALLKAYPRLGGGAEDVLRLRGRILILLYGRGLGREDVVALIGDMLRTDLDATVGLLWDLADALPAGDLAAIADGIAALAPPDLEDEFRRPVWDAASFINRILDRVSAEVIDELSGPQVLAWIELRQRLRGLNDDERKQIFRTNIKNCRPLVRAVFDAAVDAHANEEPRGRAHRLFYGVLGPLAQSEEICDWCLERLETETDAAKRKFLFEFAADLCRGATLEAMTRFERVFALAESDTGFAAQLAPYLFCDLQYSRTDHAERAAARTRERAEQHEETRRKFAQEREQVRLGQSSLLHFAADLYFARYTDFNEKVSPRERIAEYLSEDDAEPVLAGLRAFATAKTRTPPTLEHILAKRLKGLGHTSWRTFAAGVDIMVRAGEMDQIPLPLVKAALTIDLFESLSDRIKRKNHDPQSTQEILRRAFPDIAAEVYERVVAFDLEHKSGGAYIHGFYEYLDDEGFRASRRTHLLPWLAKHKDLEPRKIEHMLDAALADAELHSDLKQHADRALVDKALDGKQRALWLAASYVLDPAAARADVKAALSADPKTAWALRDALGYESRFKKAPLWPLPTSELGFLIAEIGAVWPRADFPDGVASGNTNPWDATQFVANLIDRLSSLATLEATQELERLVNDGRLSSYQFGLKNALATQLVRRREKEYDRPDWRHTLSALANQAPANAADLHALTFDHLESLAKIIDGSNTDQFKQFWNEDRYGRLSAPKPEESCRDVLATMLKQRLELLGLNAEPEAKMSAKKRVDIAVLGAALKTVIEVKLAHSPDLWEAMTSQLDRLYTRDPDTKGFGILLVFWFGAKSPKPITRRDGDGWAAPSAAALQTELAAQNTSSKLAVIVIDVSGERARTTNS